MTYDRILTAALAETQSTFGLAEALALDIPPRHHGPQDDSTTVLGYLREVREAIIAAGGEPKHEKTLLDYRHTALWVSTDLGTNFRWVPGRSYSAHNEARSTGMTYEAFTAMPKATVDIIRAGALRRDGTERHGTDGPPDRIVENWTTAQRAEAARQMLAEPQVADAVFADPEVHGHIMQAQIRHNREQMQAGIERAAAANASPGTRQVNHRLSERSAQLHLGKLCDDFATGIAENLPSAGQLADSERFWLSGARDRAATALAALSDYLETGNTGLDAELENILRGGDSGGDGSA